MEPGVDHFLVCDEDKDGADDQGSKDSKDRIENRIEQLRPLGFWLCTCGWGGLRYGRCGRFGHRNAPMTYR